MYRDEVFSLLFAFVHKIACDYFTVSDVIISLLLFIDNYHSSHYLLHMLILNFPHDFDSIFNKLLHLSIQLNSYKTNQYIITSMLFLSVFFPIVSLPLATFYINQSIINLYVQFFFLYLRTNECRW